MRRREFIALFSGAAAWPLAARAQQSGKVHRIGFLGSADPVGYADKMKALRLGLRDYGYVEGKNISVEERWAEGKYDRLPALAAELVRLNVGLIITHGTPAALAAKQATTIVPIVMAIVGNPVQTGIVTSLARPGGNITGSSFFDAELTAKRLEIMKELVPSLARAAVLVNPDNRTTEPTLRVVGETARALNVELRVLHVRNLDELDAALERARTQIEALVVHDDAHFIADARRIGELARSRRVPSIGFSEYAEAGGLVAYGVDVPHLWRHSMLFVDKILNGAKPADLPIQQAILFEFVINLKTAKTLGVAIPPTLLARATTVIE